MGSPPPCHPEARRRRRIPLAIAPDAGDPSPSPRLRMTRFMFITFEGIEGSGKTTQQQRVAEHLRARGKSVVVTKEPGGTPLADRIRAILLDSANVIDPIAEVFLFAASRRQHTTEIIEPALARGEIVL